MSSSPTPTIKGTKSRITPLFQVAYDRTLCRPLGTLVDFDKTSQRYRDIQYKLKSKSTTSDLSIYSPSPDLPSISPPSSPKLEIDETVPSVNVSANLIKKDSLRQLPNIRQNVLTVFEFSTVYPFIYGNNKFKCFVCSQPYLETPLLKMHMSESHNFSSLKRLINNKKENVLKVDVSSIQCNLCTEIPRDLNDLKLHLKEVHEKNVDPDVKDNMIPFKLDGGNYKCVMCDEIFLKVRLLVIHMSVHFNNYSCEVCGSGFMTLRLLKKHLEVHENGKFPCDQCDKIFSTPHKRSLHIRGVHLKKYPRRCPLCPERFNSNYRRTIHLQDVHNQTTRVHKCEKCGRSFNLKYHLICHNRSVHLQIRNQQCDVCLQRFCNKETLKRHMVIHTGEKNYKCEICGMAFLRRKNLRDHFRVHDAVHL